MGGSERTSGAGDLSERGSPGKRGQRLVSYDGCGRESANMMLYPARAGGSFHNRQFLNKAVRGLSEQTRGLGVGKPMQQQQQQPQHFMAMGVSLQKNIQQEIYRSGGARKH